MPRPSKRNIPAAGMYRVLKKAGAKRVSDEASEELARAAENYANTVAKIAVDVYKSAKRKTVKATDVELADRTLRGAKR